ncbi:MAG: right-handed parallel beta-helix repeat-containing protein [Planctomycetia bacterium]|nr:right-handed parallel beta-helix repeat-containing protein [Planctomycetia bacterium]
MMKRFVCVFFATMFASLPLFAATYYVSPSGNDASDGTSPQSAWQSLQKVHATPLLPGDQVLFERGGVWRHPDFSCAPRAVLCPASGEPGKEILYGAYGDPNAAKPAIYGSVDASNEEDWEETAPGIWATRKVKIEYGARIQTPFFSPWNLHREAGAVASLTSTKLDNLNPYVRVDCAKNGTAPNHIQLWGPEVDASVLPEKFVLRFRARASVPFELGDFRIIQSSFPYRTKIRRIASPAKIQLDREWQSFEVAYSLIEETTLAEGMKFRWHLSLGGMPAECCLELEQFEVVEADVDARLDLGVDVGNIIFDHGNFKKGHRCGVKKWSVADCQKPGDYFYDPAARRVFLRWNENPAKTCDSIELAMKAHVVSHGGCHDAIFDNLAICYGAAHGFGGSNATRTIIRNCDIFYIGGAHQFTREDGKPVRYGNGIEFWNCATDCLVENNRLWEIYDAALTNQGRGSKESPSVQKNIVYRGNTIWNSEYSFEYWNREGTTENILFENNKCFDAGFGWAHTQRPNPNGAHMMFYNNSAATKNFLLRGNQFFRSTEVCLRMDNDWRAGLRLENNEYEQFPGCNVVRFLVHQYFDTDSFDEYQKEVQIETGSTCRASERSDK